MDLSWRWSATRPQLARAQFCLSSKMQSVSCFFSGSIYFSPLSAGFSFLKTSCCTIWAFYLYTLNFPISLSDACRPHRQLWQLCLQYERVPHPLWQRPHRSQGDFEILISYWFYKCYLSARISVVNWSWWDIIPFIFYLGWYNLDFESRYVCWKIILSETSFTCGDHFFQILSKLGSPTDIKMIASWEPIVNS